MQTIIETPADTVPIPGFPDYRVSRYGVVWSRKIRGSKTGRLGPWHTIKPKVCNGYYFVNLYKGPGDAVSKPIHQLVMLAFVGQCPPGQMVRHLDCNKKNNRLSNLAYGTVYENHLDSLTNGDISCGERHYNAKWTNDQIREVRRLASTKMPYAEIGAQFGMSSHYVARIACREIWKLI